jgi:hypothetical protein
MRKWVFALFVIFSLLVPISAHAQDPVSIGSLVIDIWPEYDKPSVLVIYHISLSSSTTFPANLSIRIPTAAGEPYAVAERQVSGSLYTINHTRQVIGNWAIISFTTTESEVQLEYYDPSLIIEGNSRHFQYTWSGDYAVSQLTIRVQEPVGATGMRISPSLGAGEVGSDGFTYFAQDLGAVSAEQNIQITVDYQKSSSTLSVENLPIEPSAPIPSTNAVFLNFSTLLPWILGVLGAGLIIGGSIWFWQSGRQRPASQASRRRTRKASYRPETYSTPDEDVIYCSQCGKRAQPGDLYCRSCGAPIRTH